MNKRAFKLAILSGLFCSIFLNPQVAEAQYYDGGGSRFIDNLVLNLNAGPTLFYGDISIESPLQNDSKLGFGVVLRKQISPTLSVGTQILKAKLRGSVLNWPSGDPANLSFDASIIEFNLHSTFNFSDAILGHNPQRIVDFYGFAGIGISNWESTSLNSETNDVRTNGFDPEGNSAWTPELIFPMGIGVRVNLSSTIGLTMESIYHIVNSDNLDTYSIDEKINDAFLYTSIGLSFNLSGLSKTSVKSGAKSNKLPLAVEYDPRFSFEEEKKVLSKSNITTETIVDLPPAEVTVIDDGKHLITAVQSDSSTSIVTNVIVDKNTLSSGVIHIPETGTMYTVQIMASHKPVIKIPKIRRKYFTGKQIFRSQKDDMYRYSAGYFQSYEDATIYCKQLKENGLTDAFVAMYQNGIRILHRLK
ncbi:MAG: SPOR domain-containing protein [Bacteroidetes bacterium]|nr:SPOR domain-containing protein [Bacteroidota bacterium]